MVGRYTGGGGVLNQQALPSNDVSQVEGVVRAVVSDGRGGWYIGGLFSAVGGVARQNLAHINPDGSLDTDFKAATDSAEYSVKDNVLKDNGVYSAGRKAKGVYALVKTDDGLFVGGAFTTIGQDVSALSASKYLAKLDLNTGAPKVRYSDLDGAVMALATDNTKVYLGGDFTNHIRSAAALGTTATLSRIFSMETDHAIFSLVFAKDVLYLGGAFTYITHANGTATTFTEARSSVASFKVENDTYTITQWQPSLNGPVNAIAVNPAFSGQYNPVYIGGFFTTVNGSSRSNIAYFHTDSGASEPALDQTFISKGTDGIVTSLALPGSSSSIDTLYVGGQFNLIDGKPLKKIAAINIQNKAVKEDWKPAVNGNVRVLASDSSNLYVGGDFALIGQYRARFAAMDVYTGMPTPLSISIDPLLNGSESSQVSALALYKDTLYVGGAFTTVDNASQPNLFAYNLKDESVITWTPTVNGLVRAIALYPLNTTNPINAHVFIGGDFTAPHKSLAMILPDGQHATAWNPNPDGSVYALMYDKDQNHNRQGFTGAGVLNVGGAFSNVTGKAGSSFVQYDLSANGTVSDTSNNLRSNSDLVQGAVYAIATAGDNLYLGGPFTAVNSSGTYDSNYRQFVVFKAATGKLLTGVTIINTKGAPSVSAIAVSGYIYFGGEFTQLINNWNRNNLASYAPYSGASGWNTGQLSGWNPDASGTVHTLSAYDDLIYIGGAFTTLGGQHSDNQGFVNK